MAQSTESQALDTASATPGIRLPMPAPPDVGGVASTLGFTPAPDSDGTLVAPAGSSLDSQIAAAKASIDSAVKTKADYTAKQASVSRLQGMQNLATNLMSQVPEAERQVAQANAEALGQEAQDKQQDRDQLKQIMDAYKKKEVKPIDAPPDYQALSPIEKFGSFGSMLGIFASSFTKKPLVNALNASAGAMKAADEGNLASYNAHMDKFKTESDAAAKQAKEETEHLKEILDMYKEDSALATAQAKALAAQKSWPALALLASVGDIEGIAKLQESLIKGYKGLDNSGDAIKDAYLKARTDAANKQANLYAAKTEAIKSGALTPALRVKVEDQDNIVTNSLNDIDQAQKILNDTFAVAGIGGSIRSRTEPLANLFGSNNTAEAQFADAMGKIKIALPGLIKGTSGRSLSADSQLVDDIVGGKGWGQSMAGTYAKLDDWRNALLKDHNLYQTQLSGFDTAKAAVQSSEEPDEGADWMSAPIVSGAE